MVRGEGGIATETPNAVSANTDHQVLGRVHMDLRGRDLELAESAALVEWAAVQMKGFPGACWKGAAGASVADPTHVVAAMGEP